MKEEILKILSKKEMRVGELKKKIKDEKLELVLKEMKNSGLIFVKKDQSYSITLLGKILALGKKDIYKKIVERKDLFDFFKTRIPSAIPDELLSKFKFCEDLQLIGEPDFTNREREIYNRILGIQPHTEREICTSAPVVFKASGMHIIAVLKKRPKIRSILPQEEYEKKKIFIKINQKFANWEVRKIKKEDQYMGLLDIDNKFCFFGFRTVENKPGWDALISTENKECIEWVKENFDYMWNNLARKP